ncbi:hypothetical protein [Allosphingosinicella indica]|uniref:Nodulation-related protein NoeB n=1 Tax=Allosphingosinicella indica TaxID=941907 RepID=A0A1X7H0E4_9SPHN|nr:hypothetical protein [Allosphingosinicella indica]SMF77278.1 nodulation-related protein NoeB [Allosphingosinicella indica]
MGPAFQRYWWRDGDSLLRVYAWAAMLLASLLNFLNHNQYPAWRAEVTLAALAMVALGLALGVVHRLAMPRLSFLFTALLAALAVDLNGDRLWLVPAAFGATLVVAFFADRAAVKLIAAAFTGVLVFQLAGLHGDRPDRPAFARKAAPDPAAGPPIVHLILDGYMGLGGMAADPAAFGALRDANTAFFRRHGFRLYGNAYSEHRNTTNSLPHILSFGQAAPATTPQRLQHSVPGPLAYFGLLRRASYKTYVLQTDYIDLCARQGVAGCSTYPRSDLATMDAVAMPTSAKAETILSSLASLAVLPTLLDSATLDVRSSLAGEAVPPLEQRAKLFPIASMAAMDRLTASLAGARRGEAYVAHLLLPHDPYLYDAACKVKPRSAWTFEEAEGDRVRRDADYAAQSRCLLTRLDAMLAVLAKSPDGRDAIVILHGDHGSRIVDIVPELGQPGEPSPRDYAMTYSTLFAVRGPGVAPGEDGSAAPVASLLGAFAAFGFAATPDPAGAADAERHVLLTDDRWTPRRKVPLPAFERPAL